MSVAADTSSHRGAAERPTGRLALAFVLVVWIAMTVAANVYVARYASPIPFMDDMELVDALLPDARVGWDYLWSQANEHRILLPRVVYLAGLRLTHDFQFGMYFQVWAQAALALGLALYAGRLRGRASFADAFFPLLLLHWGNAENFLLGMQITIAVPTVLASTFVALALRKSGAPGHGSAIAMVLCAFLLPLNGGFGLMQLPPLLVWMIGAAWCLRRSEAAEQRATARVFAVGALATLALVAFYFVDFRFPPPSTRTLDLPSVVRTAVQFLSLNLGPVAERWRILAPVTVLGFAALALLFALSAWRTRAERGRVAAVLAGLAAAGCIAFAIGISRGPSGYSAGLANRYVILPAPFWITSFLALCVFGPRRIAEAAQALACLALLVVLPLDFRYGAWRGGIHVGGANALVDSIGAGMPYEEVVEQNWRAFYPTPEGFGARLMQLREAGYAPFEALAPGKGWPTSDSHFMFDPRPRRIDAPEKGRPRKLKDGYAFVLRADNSILIGAPSTATELDARFGMLPNTWNGNAPDGARTAGLRFRVEARTKDAPARVLFERELRPGTVAADRGAQTLHVALPREPELELVLRMEALSGAASELDVGWWSDVRAH